VGNKGLPSVGRWGNIARRQFPQCADSVQPWAYWGANGAGYLGMDWKRANVSPVHKKGSRVQAENYRPISLASQLCKVFETY